ncbi:hypothetical protein C900_00547 [Fulvivirga imtechensis AK7]|uniref:SusD/RagB family nutrient-binding outer membrane lipoprotein n=1 Tax=Fulvivirga imtechensis AK7 TaxID=1237149 RepID=L8JHN5_9BACT|nr:SusD/RagB family nutrient-binding outer membrane lipoprotein [Fulvivirga imtechensis]ELR68320.1 hypothetical protein C900_00547 [Fulvivirga imtechensis AK7]
MNIKINIYKILAFNIILLLAGGCTDDFEEINTNPNGPAKLDNIGPLLTHAQQNIYAPSRFVTWRENVIFGSRFAEHWSFGFQGTWFANASGFQGGTDWHYGVWDDSWGLVNAVSNNNIGDLAELLRLTGPEGEFASEADYGVVLIMRVMLLQRIADNYGAIPFSDGGTGVAKPVFQQLDEVYPLMIEDLDRAMNLIGNATNSGLGAADQVYGGDYQKWKRLANSEKLKLAIRARSASGNNFSNQAITEAVSSPLLQSNDDNLVIQRDPSLTALRQGFANIWSFGTGGQWVMAKRLVEHLDGTVLGTPDPRLAQYADPAVNSGNYVGQEVGLDASSPLVTSIDNFSTPDATIVNQDPQFPSYVFTYAEAEFLQAEAALFGMGGTNANAHYQAGIRASMEQWGVSEADIQVYLASPAGSLSGTQEDQFRQISIQRWIAAYTNGSEAWAIVRRTGYPVIEDKTDPRFFDTSGWADNKLPQRLLYSTTEYTLNGKNLESALQRQGPDKMTTKLWWAK